MKFLVLYPRTSREVWFESALAVYLEKLRHFYPIEVKPIASLSASRSRRNQKVKSDDAQILAELRSSDLVFGFDEKGKNFEDSRSFSRFLVNKIEMSRPRLVFVLGGAFGLGDDLRERADALLSLGPLTLNHQLALVVALEQIYRGLTIWKGIPYHND